MATSSTSSPSNIRPDNWLRLQSPQHPPLNTNEGIDALVQKINQNWIIALDLSGQHMGEAQAINLARKLRGNRTIISLNLSDNGITKAGAKKINKILFAKDRKDEPNQTLIYLKIDNRSPIRKLHDSKDILKQIIAFVEFINNNTEEEIPQKFLNFSGQSFIELDKDYPRDLDIANYYEKLPLIHIAASVGNVRVLKHFIHEQPYLVNLGDKNCVTPLQRAVHEGKENTTRLLIQSGAQLNDSPEVTPLNPGPPLHISLVCHPEMLETILKTANEHHCEFDIDIHGSINPPPLLTAIKNNRLSAIRLLLKHGAKISDFAQPNLDPLYNILRWWNEELSKINDDHIPDVSSTSESTATSGADLFSSKLRRVQPISSDSRGSYNSPVGNVPVLPGTSSIANRLLAMANAHNIPAPSSIINANGINNKYKNILIELLNADGVNLNYQLPEITEDSDQTNGGYTLLHMAIASGQADLVQKLIVRGANPMLKDSTGRTSLDLARQQRFQASVEHKPKEIRLYHQICRDLENHEKISEQTLPHLPKFASSSTSHSPLDNATFFPNHPDDLDLILIEMSNLAHNKQFYLDDKIFITEIEVSNPTHNNRLHFENKTLSSKSKLECFKDAPEFDQSTKRYSTLCGEFYFLVKQNSDCVSTSQVTLEVDRSYSNDLSASSFHTNSHSPSLTLPHLVELCDLSQKIIDTLYEIIKISNDIFLPLADNNLNALETKIHYNSLRNLDNARIREQFTYLDMFRTNIAKNEEQARILKEKYTALRAELVQFLNLKLKEQYIQLIQQESYSEVEAQIEHLISLWTDPRMKNDEKKTVLDIVLEIRSKMKDRSLIQQCDMIGSELLKISETLTCSSNSSSTTSSTASTTKATSTDKLLTLITPIIGPLCSDYAVHKNLLSLLEKTVDNIDSSTDNIGLNSLLDEASREGTPAVLDTLLVRDGSQSIDKIEHLIKLAIDSGNVQTIEYLIYLGANLCGESFFTKNVAFLQMTRSPSLEVQQLKGELEARIEDLEARHEAYRQETETKIRALSMILNIELRHKIQSFFDRPYEGEYFKTFYSSLCFIFATEWEGMRTALSHWVTTERTTSMQTLDFLTALSRASPFPGTSAAAAVLALIPKKLAEDAMIERITAVAQSFPLPDDTQNFIQTLCYYLMEIFQNQIILLDRKSPHHSYEVDQKAIQQFARSLFSRIVLYMFTQDAEFSDDPLNHSAVSISEKAQAIALSTIWGKTSKVAQIEYLKEDPFFNCGISILPTRRQFSLVQQTKAKIRAGGKKIKKLPKYLYERKHKNTSIIVGKEFNYKLITDNGMCCKAPVKVGKSYYEPTGCRPEDYAALIVSEEGLALIQAMTHKDGGLFKISNRPNRETIRLTRSYRELYLEQIPITDTIPQSEPLTQPVQTMPDFIPSLQEYEAQIKDLRQLVDSLREEILTLRRAPRHELRPLAANIIVTPEEFLHRTKMMISMHDIEKKIKKLSKRPDSDTEKKHQKISDLIHALNPLHQAEQKEKEALISKLRVAYSRQDAESEIASSSQ